MYADDNSKDFPKDNLAKHITTELDKVDVWLNITNCLKMSKT